MEEAVDTGAGREARSADQRQPSANLNQPAQLPPGRVGCPSSARYGMYVHNIHSDDCSSAPSVEPFLDPPAGLFCYSCATCVIKVLLRVAFPVVVWISRGRLVTDPRFCPEKQKTAGRFWFLRCLVLGNMSRVLVVVAVPDCCVLTNAVAYGITEKFVRYISCRTAHESGEGFVQNDVILSF